MHFDISALDSECVIVLPSDYALVEETTNGYVETHLPNDDASEDEDDECIDPDADFETFFFKLCLRGTCKAET